MKSRSASRRTRPRGRRAVLLASGGTLLVLSLAVFTFRGLIAETWYRAWLRSSDPYTSEQAALELIELHSTRAVPELVEAAHRHAYLETLVFLMEDEYSDEEYAAALPELRKVLEEENPFEWMAALKILKRLGPRAAPAAPRLVEAFEFWSLSPDFNIHHDIIEILASLEPSDVPRSLFEQALEDRDPEIRRLAREALEARGGSRP